MNIDKLLPCTVRLVKIIQKSSCDVLCVIDSSMSNELHKQFEEMRCYDKAFDSMVSCFKSQQLDLPVVYSPLPNLTDYHDVRSFKEAAAKCLKRAIQAGFKSPLLLVPKNKRFPQAELCSILGALEEIYVPIQLREDVPEKSRRLDKLSLLISNSEAEEIYKDAIILETGRFIARDIGVGDPERMSAPRVEQYISKLFGDLQMSVISDINVLEKEYPLFAAVNRAANLVKRHQGRIIFLEYKPPKPARKTLMLVGKGVTYDTGGADIKAGGIMSGMSRDKCGAAAVAGFMQIVKERKPSNIHVIAALCMVRNSVGHESYVSDEIITSRSGVRVRVGNTDAEGRMCMADALCRMKELAINENLPDPHLFTIATLTGHAYLAVGKGYSIAIDNSVAHSIEHVRKLQEIGEIYGDPFEVSILRKDDFEKNASNIIGEDIVQCNNISSMKTPRGHQMPVAFLIQVTGLDKHDLYSEMPLKYTHIDIVGSAGEYPEMPTASTVIALVKAHLS